MPRFGRIYAEVPDVLPRSHEPSRSFALGGDCEMVGEKQVRGSQRLPVLKKHLVRNPSAYRPLSLSVVVDCSALTFISASAFL